MDFKIVSYKINEIKFEFSGTFFVNIKNSNQ